MNWTNCFSDERYGITNYEKGIRSDFERDWDRIVFSSPFRRLQNKTQVFPLPEEVFVHNRLTHSLEVASVGRSLGAMVGQEIINNIEEVKQNPDAERFYTYDLKHVVASACLAHDMGNPAFGHAGEDAISKYFIDRDTQKEEDLKFKGLFTKEQWNDLTHFEGNANTLRILTKQYNGRQFGGSRLTYSTLGSILKYPCESLATQKKGAIHRKKYGFFDDDKDVFLAVVAKLKMIPDTVEGMIVYKRHPFVYLVEAADDICYNIIDYEDAHRLGILSYSEVKEHLMQIIAKHDNEDMSRFEKRLSAIENDKNEAVTYLRAKSINCLTHKCARVFIENQESIIDGTFNVSLLDKIDELSDVLKAISKKSIEKIYSYDGVVRIELAGFRIMSGLIEDFIEAAFIEESKRTRRHDNTLNLLSAQFKIDASSNAYTRVMNIIDYISGMTDLFALKLYRNLRGIEMPHI